MEYKMNEITTQNWYKDLVEECRSIITESTFTSRWALVEGYWNLGKKILEEQRLDRKEIYGKKIVQGLAESIGISERTLNYAIQTYEKYPQIDTLPEGKNISWNKLVTKYLPERIEKRDTSKESKTLVCPNCGFRYKEVNNK